MGSEMCIRDNPAAMQQATGFKQEEVNDLPFAVIYARHMGHPPAAAAKFQARLGGDLTLPNPLEHLASSNKSTGQP